MVARAAGALGHIGLQCPGRQRKARVVKCLPVGQRIVAVGHVHEMAPPHDAVIDRAPAVDAVLKDQAWILAAQRVVDFVVAVRRAPPDVDRRGRVVVVAAFATRDDDRLIVLEHVEVVLPNDPPQPVETPLSRRGRAETARLAAPCLGPPTGGQVGGKPVSHDGLENAQDVRPGNVPALRPGHPKTELHALAVGVVGQGPQPVRELLGVTPPIADRLIPAGVDVEHLEAQGSTVVDHLPADRFVDLAPATPAIVGQQRQTVVARRRQIPPLGPTVEPIAAGVDVALVAAEKNGRTRQTAAAAHDGGKRRHHLVESENHVERRAVARLDLLGNVRAGGDSRIPSVAMGRVVHALPGYGLAAARLLGSWRRNGPMAKTGADRRRVSTHLRRRPGALFHPAMFQRRAGRGPQPQRQARHSPERDVARRSIDHRERLLNRSRPKARLPGDVHLQPGRIGQEPGRHRLAGAVAPATNVRQ